MARVASAHIQAPHIGAHERVPVAPDLVERLRLSGLVTAIALGAGLYLALILAARADFGPGFGLILSDADRFPNWWRVSLEEPLLITYILLVHRFLDEYLCRAIEAFRPLVLLDDRTFNGYLAHASRAVLRFQWLAILVGAAVGSLLMELWVSEHPQLLWHTAVEVVTGLLLYALIGSIIYLFLARYQLFSKLYLLPLKIDIFDLGPLRPMARWGLAVSASILGAVSLSMLVLGAEHALDQVESLVAYTCGLITAVILFFGSLYSTHIVMLRTKERELRVVHDHLSAMYDTLKKHGKTGDLREATRLSRWISAWLAYEKRIQDVPEWPYTAATLRGLGASVLLPILIGVAQQLMFLW